MEPSVIIRAAIGLNMLVFGVHQLLKPTEWTPYIPKWLSRIDPLSDNLTMRLHAAGNILLGPWLLSGILQSWSVWAAFLWMLSIVPFALWHKWDIGVRDAVIAASLFALIRML